MRPTDDLRIKDVRPLVPPAILLEELPITDRASNVVADTRAAVADIVQGKDSKLVVVVVMEAEDALRMRLFKASPLTRQPTSADSERSRSSAERARQ